MRDWRNNGKWTMNEMIFITSIITRQHCANYLSNGCSVQAVVSLFSSQSETESSSVRGRLLSFELKRIRTEGNSTQRLISTERSKETSQTCMHLERTELVLVDF